MVRSALTVLSQPRMVVSSASPGSMEVVGHDMDGVEVPRNRGDVKALPGKKLEISSPYKMEVLPH